MLDTLSYQPHRELTVNLFKPTHPLVATLVSNTRLTRADDPTDVRHLVFDLGGSGFHYHEGQSVGVMAPGVDENGKPHRLRLYSIASCHLGDSRDGRTLSLCVKRVRYPHPESGEMILGAASNYLCDLAPGDVAHLTGPVGRTFLLPADPTANIVMMATGTGIAPFRAFVQNLFRPGYEHTGQVRLFFGAMTSGQLLYHDEFERLMMLHPNFRVSYAISEEQQTEDGAPMWVQERVREQGAEVWSLLTRPQTYVFICGLKGMIKGITAAVTELAEQHETDWAHVWEAYRHSHRWHVETY